MKKTLFAVAAALLAAIALTPAAEAGFKVRIGFGFPVGAFNAHGGGYSAHRHYRRHRYVARKVKKKTHVAKATSSSPKKVSKKPAVKHVAKVEPATKPVPEPVDTVDTIEIENSSITSAAEPATEETPPEQAAAATAEAPSDTGAVTPIADKAKTVNKIDCKKFFPSVGMTLSVPCE